MTGLVERLRRKLYRREIWHEPDGTMDVACDADDPGAEAYNANPDGPEAADAIETLVDALEVARGEVARHHASRSALPQIDAALANVHHGGDNK